MKTFTYFALCAASASAVDFGDGQYILTAAYDALNGEIVFTTT